eukprot:949599_1
MYSNIFKWLLRRINAAIDPNISKRRGSFVDHMSIGVLDIYGFEIFEHNSFEQFCINYVNEKLQQVFIEATLQKEQQEYLDEGIEWINIDYFNNKIVCDLIEAKPQGLISYLDEECSIPRGTDESYHTKIFQFLGQHPHLSKVQAKFRTKESGCSFVVKHYAGDVVYDSNGFIEKNKDLVWKDLVLLGESSSLELFKQLFPEGESEKYGDKRPVTRGSQFRTEVKELMGSLHSCEPHYVRCIKPNDFKRASNFDDARVQHQAKYLGLLENVRVRRAGYAFRMSYTRFYPRYKMVCKETWPHFDGSEQEATKAITTSLGWIEGTDFVFGRTKIFIRQPTSLFKLDEIRNEVISRLVSTIQAQFRGFVQRTWYKEYRAAVKIQRQYR